MQLKDAEVMATVAVKDLGRARAFYEESLGLAPASPPDPQMVAYRAGNATLLVYVSDYAGTNRANAATFNVPDGLDALVRQLQGRGVRFEQYDMPDMQREGAIHRCGDRSMAWCKDPDGNILTLAQG